MHPSPLLALAALSIASVAARPASAADAPRPFPRAVILRTAPVRPALRAYTVPAPMPVHAPVRPPSPLPNLSTAFDRAARLNARGYDPSAAIAAGGAGGSGGRYASQAVPVTQARQGTQAQPVRSLRIVRPSTFLPIPWGRRP